MGTRRRRRERRAGHERADRPRSRHEPERPAKGDARSRIAFAQRMDRLRRARTVIGALGFVPLIASLLCGVVEAFCVIPRELYLGIWAALFGSFIGLTVRMWRERRRFERTGATT